MRIRLKTIPQPIIPRYLPNIQDFTKSFLHIRTIMILCLLASDVIAIGAALGLSTWITGLALNNSIIYQKLYLIAPLFLAAFYLAGLYPGSPTNPPGEYPKIYISILATSLAASPFLFAPQVDLGLHPLWMLLVVILSVAAVPGLRWLVRMLAVRSNLWGEPVAVIGFGPSGQKLASYLLSNLQLGLRPVVAVTALPDGREDAQPIPFNQTDPQDFQELDELSRIHTGLLVLPEMPDSLLKDILNYGRFNFHRIFLIPSTSAYGLTHSRTTTFNELVGIEIQQYLAQRLHIGLKRIIDLAIILISAPLVLPLLGLLAISVLIDSRGQVFYAHERLGKYGKPFRIWKIRTMVSNADQIINEFLDQHPELQQEWLLNHKLKNDPRITRIGKLLRKTSLDELPQLWNILVGEMSLVGPRPIVASEIPHYGSSFHIYSRVKPGLTGLWQVSGRNDVGYSERVQLDEIYVRNWSIWQDLSILIRTVWVVVKGHGAY